ncbi:unnamed protein product, partial [Nesidiocoris tenuis]
MWEKIPRIRGNSGTTATGPSPKTGEGRRPLRLHHCGPLELPQPGDISLGSGRRSRKSLYAYLKEGTARPEDSEL